MFSVHELTVYSSFMFLLSCSFLLPRSLSLFCRENALKRFFIICGRPAPLEDFCTIMKCFCTTCEALCTTVPVAAQAAGFFRSWRIDLFLALKYELLQNNICLLGCERVVENLAEFHFSLVYTFCAMFSSLRN